MILSTIKELLQINPILWHQNKTHKHAKIFWIHLFLAPIIDITFFTIIFNDKVSVIFHLRDTTKLLSFTLCLTLVFIYFYHSFDFVFNLRWVLLNFDDIWNFWSSIFMINVTIDVRRLIDLTILPLIHEFSNLIAVFQNLSLNCVLEYFDNFAFGFGIFLPFLLFDIVFLLRKNFYILCALHFLWLWNLNYLLVRSLARPPLVIKNAK